jgi:hypothetical protein
MMRRCTGGLPVLAGILAMLCARPAFAETPSCTAMGIEADVSVRTRWPRLLNEVRGAFEARDDIDRCARVELVVRGASVAVEVVLPDGRSAARSVSRREDVIPTLEALLLVPLRTTQAQTPALAPSESESPPASSRSAAPAGASPPDTRDVPAFRVLAVPDRDTLAASAVHRPGRVRIELSVLTGARIGDGQTGLGLGALSFLEVSGWLVGFEGRADRYQSLSGGPTERGALELAVLGGRRFRFQNLALDLTAGPGLVPQGTTTFETRSVIRGNGVTESTSSIAPRLLLGARVSFGALSTLHTFVGLDGELGPPRAGDGDGLNVPGAPRLPIWTLGLALGATVGTQ